MISVQFHSREEHSFLHDCNSFLHFSTAITISFIEANIPRLTSPLTHLSSLSPSCVSSPSSVHPLSLPLSFLFLLSLLCLLSLPPSITSAVTSIVQPRLLSQGSDVHCSRSGLCTARQDTSYFHINVRLHPRGTPCFIFYFSRFLGVNYGCGIILRTHRCYIHTHL